MIKFLFNKGKDRWESLQAARQRQKTINKINRCFQTAEDAVYNCSDSSGLYISKAGRRSTISNHLPVVVEVIFGQNGCLAMMAELGLNARCVDHYGDVSFEQKDIERMFDFVVGNRRYAPQDMWLPSDAFEVEKVNPEHPPRRPAGIECGPMVS